MRNSPGWPAMDDITAAIRHAESQFHHPDEGVAIADLGALLAPGFQRVSAAGVVQDGPAMLRTIERRLEATRVHPWTARDESVLRIGVDTYLYTYDLHFHGRVTRRASIWRVAGRGLTAVYSQATVIPGERDMSGEEAAAGGGR